MSLLSDNKSQFKSELERGSIGSNTPKKRYDVQNEKESSMVRIRTSVGGGMGNLRQVQKRASEKPTLQSPRDFGL
jgi:hypothetical protein